MTRFLFLLLIISYSVSSQSLKKAYKFYEKGEINKFKDALIKMDEKGVDNTGKYYLYSLYYLKNKDNRDDLDSSYFYIRRTKETYYKVNEKVEEELKDLNISIGSIDSINNVIDSIEYNYVKEINSIAEYKKYMQDHNTSKFYSEALVSWHGLEFLNVRKINTWEAYNEFMVTFPDAMDFNLAKSYYEELILAEKTAEQTLNSYEDFLEKNPETPYRDSIEFLVLKYYGLGNNANNFKKFLLKYPNSIHNKFVSQLLYHSNNKDVSIFDSLGIKNKDIDSLYSVSVLDKEFLLGIYDKGSINFINQNGDIVIKGKNKHHNSSAFCSFENKDFFVISNETKTEIYNRRYDIFYSNSDVTYIEDIGSGLVKILRNGILEIIHKSGYSILSGDYDDAYLIDNKFILVEKSERYSIFSFLGDQLYDFIFNDVFQEGSFLFFENEEMKLAVSTSSQIEKKILNKNFNISFLYDDYEYFNNDHILLVSGDDEELLNSDMEYVISPSDHRIDGYDFGWTATSDFGIRVVSDILSVPFSHLYQQILNSTKYFIAKKNDLWDVKDKQLKVQVLSEVDSVYRVSDSVIWYRKGLKEALFLPNSKEIVFEGKYNFKFLTPKFGSQSYIKLFSENGDFILNLEGDTLPSAEYYYTVESGDTFSYLSKKFNISQSEILDINNKRNKKLFVGEKIKVRGYVPSDVISDSLFLIEFNGKKGIADLSGKIILEPDYDGITNQFEDDIILIKDQKFGNFNISSRDIISPSYSRLLKSIKNNYLVFNNKYGVVSSVGSQVIPFEYDDISYWNDTSYIAKKNNEFYFIDSNNNILNDFSSYSMITDDEIQIIKVGTDEGYGIYSSSHGEILKPVYNYIDQLNIDNDIFFLAKREISDANLLINLLVDNNGKIILNQALDLNDLEMIICE